MKGIISIFILCFIAIGDHIYFLKGEAVEYITKLICTVTP